jgi:c-di-GMP-binding flagellar brake protein YcgR
VSEQRRAKRYDVEIAAEVYTTEAVFSAQTRNLSESGICLIIEELISEGTVVGLSLFLTMDGIEDPDQEPLNIKAEVVWCTEQDDSGYMAGAQFAEITAEQDSSLKRFLAACEQQ